MKLKKLVAGQQFADILNKPTDEDANFVGDYSASATYTAGQIIRYQGTLYTVTATTTGNTPPNTSYFSPYGGQSIQGILSTQSKNLEINDAIIAQAEADAPKSGYETQQFYTLAVDEAGKPALRTADETDLFSDNTSLDASRIADRPKRTGYMGYLVGDGVPDNGVADFGFGLSFPGGATDGDYFLRTDYVPNRLFRYNGSMWVKREDSVRHTLTNTDARQTLKTGFINNTNSAVIDGDTVEERQPLSKALKPRADF